MNINDPMMIKVIVITKIDAKETKLFRKTFTRPERRTRFVLVQNI